MRLVRPPGPQRRRFLDPILERRVVQRRVIAAARVELQRPARERDLEVLVRSPIDFVVERSAVYLVRQRRLRDRLKRLGENQASK